MLGPTELVIADPHDQPGVVSEIPEGMGPVQIVNFYHYRHYPKKKAYCARCRARRHRDGYTVELEDGSFVLAGSTCGAELWGNRWQTVSTRFQGRLRAAGIILDVRDVLSELETIRARLESWRPVVKLLGDHQRLFKGRMPTLFKTLHDAASRPDHTIIVPGEGPQEVTGWSYFLIDNVSQQFQSALEEIDAAIAVGHGAEAELGGRTVTLGSARERLDAIAHAARGLRMFFAPDDPLHFMSFVGRLDRAISGPGRGRYIVRHERKLVEDEIVETSRDMLIDTIGQTSIGLPDDYPVLNTESLRQLYALDA